jgi:hypothetical protein
MTNHASTHLAPASAEALVSGGPEGRPGNPVVPMGDACRRAGATVDLGATPPGDKRPRHNLTHVKAGLQAATADLDRLRGRLLNALNKGLVLHEMGEVLGRLEDLWQSIPDETGPETAAGTERQPVGLNLRRASRS